MPVTYRFDTNIVILELVGEYSMDDIRTTILKSLSDAMCPANSFLLIDLGESRSIYNMSPENVKAMSHFIASLGKQFNNRIALVASKDLPFGLMRMTTIESEEWGIEAEVFRTFDQAKKWLLS